jgi:hypothetical protein
MPGTYTEPQTVCSVCIMATYLLKVSVSGLKHCIVGLPLCRNQDYLNNCIAFATHVTRAGAAIDIFPKFLKPFVSLFPACNIVSRV